MSNGLRLIKTGQQWFVLSLDSPAFVCLQDGFQNQSIFKKAPMFKNSMCIVYTFVYDINYKIAKHDKHTTFHSHSIDIKDILSIWCQKLNMFQLMYPDGFPFWRLHFAPKDLSTMLVIFAVIKATGTNRSTPGIRPHWNEQLGPENMGNPKRKHPGRLTWNIIMEVWKMIFLSKWVIFRFHVNLPGWIRFEAWIFRTFAVSFREGTWVFHNLVIFVKGTLLTFMIILFEPVVRHGPRYISLHLVGFYGKLVGTYTSPIDPIAAKLLPPKLTDGTPKKMTGFLHVHPEIREDELFNEHIFSDGKINGPTRTSVWAFRWLFRWWLWLVKSFFRLGVVVVVVLVLVLGSCCCCCSEDTWFSFNHFGSRSLDKWYVILRLVSDFWGLLLITVVPC